MGLQLVAADVGFFIYGHNNGWDIPAAAISVWLGAVVVQLFLLLRVIAKYLFPEGSSPHGVSAPRQVAGPPKD